MFVVHRVADESIWMFITEQLLYTSVYCVKRFIDSVIGDNEATIMVSQI